MVPLSSHSQENTKQRTGRSDEEPRVSLPGKRVLPCCDLLPLWHWNLISYPCNYHALGTQTRREGGTQHAQQTPPDDNILYLQEFYLLSLLEVTKNTQHQQPISGENQELAPDTQLNSFMYLSIFINAGQTTNQCLYGEKVVEVSLRPMTITPAKVQIKKTGNHKQGVTLPDHCNYLKL